MIEKRPSFWSSLQKLNDQWWAANQYLGIQTCDGHVHIDSLKICLQRFAKVLSFFLRTCETSFQDSFSCQIYRRVATPTIIRTNISIVSMARSILRSESSILLWFEGYLRYLEPVELLSILSLRRWATLTDKCDPRCDEGRVRESNCCFLRRSQFYRRESRQYHKKTIIRKIRILSSTPNSRNRHINNIKLSESDLEIKSFVIQGELEDSTTYNTHSWQRFLESYQTGNIRAQIG